ncbi:hypothetical protein [Rhizobium sp. 9140]|uniref:hypothetical protein n=1 Tax=Rhizobium sp. 9140 TaxID=1761900 RepID=UPI000ADB9CA2|nr:hypothetical protein [Rhizobium sp. 9140]
MRAEPLQARIGEGETIEGAVAFLKYGAQSEIEAKHRIFHIEIDRILPGEQDQSGEGPDFLRVSLCVSDVDMFRVGIAECHVPSRSVVPEEL